METLDRIDPLGVVFSYLIQPRFRGYWNRRDFVESRPLQESLTRKFRSSFLGPVSVIWLTLIVLCWTLPAPAQSQQPSEQQSPGSINGTVVDRTGAVVAGARVRLTRQSQSPNDQSPNQEVLSGDNGQFSLANVPPGPFQLTITSAGFAAQPFSGALHSGETHYPATSFGCLQPALRCGSDSPIEVAEEQVQDEEKQRVLGFIPNFYVSYAPHPLPLSSKQKFALAWKTAVDPVSLRTERGHRRD